MTKDDFLKINRIIGELPPDNSIRIEYLEKQFSDLGLSKESGYKAVQYFYNELRKAKDGLNSIFKGKIIINENDKTFGIVDHFTCYFKMTIEGFEKRNEIFFPINLPPQPISVNESRTKKVIVETITNIDKQGWQYAFVSEKDYNLFTDLLTNFFEYKPYTLPETIIQLKRTCKTKVAKALGEIHKELSNENQLTTDTKYFQLIRVLSHFEKETEGDLYKALTR